MVFNTNEKIIFNSVGELVGAKIIAERTIGNNTIYPHNSRINIEYSNGKIVWCCQKVANVGGLVIKSNDEFVVHYNEEGNIDSIYSNGEDLKVGNYLSKSISKYYDDNLVWGFYEFASNESTIVPSIQVSRDNIVKFVNAKDGKEVEFPLQQLQKKK